MGLVAPRVPGLPSEPRVPSPPALGPPLSTFSGVTLVAGTPAMPAAPLAPWFAVPPVPPREPHALIAGQAPRNCRENPNGQPASAPFGGVPMGSPLPALPPSVPSVPAAPWPAVALTRRNTTAAALTTMPMLLSPG